MGGKGSTRRVVVEEVDGSGVVKISDSVVKRIRGEEGGETDTKSYNQKGGETDTHIKNYDQKDGETDRKSFNQRGVETDSKSYSQTGGAAGDASSSGDAPKSYARASSPSFSPSSSPAYGSPVSIPLSDKDRAMVEDIEAFYTGKLKELEQRNSELQKITNEQFVKAVQEIEQKFLKHTCAPVCQDMQSRVYECYLDNPRQTLNCSTQVRAFSACVERARQNALLRKS